jgi:DNA polymerase-4
MPAARAKQLCPLATWVPPDWRYYAPASKQFHAILADFTPLVEPAGSDEAYLDVRGCERLFGDAAAIAATIRTRVRGEIGITASVGVSVNKLVSKVASDACKPDGLLVVAAGTEAAFLAPRPLRDLPMIGPKTAERLAALGARRIGDVATLPAAVLRARFGQYGDELHERALGRSSARVLAGQGEAKSVSRENTFGKDVGDVRRLRALLRDQAERVAADLARQEKCARTVTLKLRFPPFETLTRSHTPAGAVEIADEVFAVGVEMFERAWAENGRRPVRLLGLGVMNLRPRARQLRLGETLEADRLAETVASLRDRFGPDAVRRAAEIEGRDSPLLTGADEGNEYLRALEGLSRD